MMSKKKSLVEKIINTLLNIFIVFFALILLITIYGNVQTKIFGKNYSDFFGYSLFEVQTGSMADTINPGDWIIVKYSKNYKLNDVITYKYNNEYITHRIIESYSSTYITKGDANNSKDAPINKDQVIGKVVKVLAGFGIFKKTVFNPIVLVAIIITIMLFNFAFKNTKEKKPKDNKIISKLNKEIKISLPKIKKKEKVIKIKNIVEQKKEIADTRLAEEPVHIENEVAEDEISSYIPVDVSEIDDTFLEIAENEIEEPVKKEIVNKIEEEIIDEKPTKINLELFENTKKSKNIIEKVIAIKIEELNEIFEIIDDDGKTYVNEPTIKNSLMSSYIDARYYNYYGDCIDNTNGKKLSLKLEKLIKSKESKMINSYKGTDLKYADKVNRFSNIFILISNLDQAKDLITDSKAKSEFYKKEITKYSKIAKWNNQKIKSIMSDVMKIQRNYIGILDYFYKKLETNMFTLNINNLTSKKNMFGVSLEHNISFSKVYSDYIIDKTYSEGIIAEDKFTVLLTLLSAELSKNMIMANFNKKYVLYIPKSLYSKEKKFEKSLKMVNDEYAKDNVIFLIAFADLIKYKVLIKKARKNGYKFAVVFDEYTIVEAKNYSSIYLTDYIFVDKKVVNVVKMLSTMPEDLADKIIYEDIANVIGDFGGE